MAKKETKKKMKNAEETGRKSVDRTLCADKDCPVHGNLKVRGRVFEGEIIRKFHKRITIGFERTIYVRKYERYAKAKTKIHARLPICMEDSINVGDFVRVQECRPLSKIIHFVVVKKIKSKAGEDVK